MALDEAHPGLARQFRGGKDLPRPGGKCASAALAQVALIAVLIESALGVIRRSAVRARLYLVRVNAFLG